MMIMIMYVNMLVIDNVILLGLEACLFHEPLTIRIIGRYINTAIFHQICGALAL